MPQRRQGFAAAGLLLVALAAYLANDRLMPSAGDDIPNRLIPFSLLGWGTPALEPFRSQLQGKSINPAYLLEIRGRLVSLYSPATAVVALPVYLPWYLWLRAHGHSDALYLSKASVRAGKLAAAVIAAACVAVLYLLLLARGTPPATAALIALAFGLATDMWVVSSQLLWQHGPGVLCILLGMSGLAPAAGGGGLPQGDLTEPPGEGSPSGARRVRLTTRLMAAGLALGFAAAIRPQNGVFLLAAAALCAWEGAGLMDKAQRLLALAAGAALPLAAIATYNARYVGVLLGGYGIRVGSGGFAASDLPYGVAGLLFSPNRGLLWFSPVALIGVWGMVLALRRWRSEPWLACFSAAAVLVLLIHGAYRVWTGGGSFGPRYLIEALPVLAVAAAAAVPQLASGAARRAAGALLAWSILVQVDGAFCYPLSRWDARMSNETARRAWDLRHWVLAEDFHTWLAGRLQSSPPAPVPMPAAAFRVAWLGLTWEARDQPQPYLLPRMQARANVTFRNAGRETWPDAAAADPALSGVGAVRLAYDWRQGAAAACYGERRDLREPLPPGGATTLRILVIAPPAPGDYTLQFDLVQENVAWFEARGAPPFQLPMHIAPAGQPPPGPGR